jgi:hypothetical protein
MASKLFFRILSWAIASIGVALLLSGCADKANPDNVDKRAIERWNYLIEHNAEKAYDYLTPGTRNTKSREDYAGAMNTRPLQWKAVKFKSKRCDADRCTVLIDVTYTMPVARIAKPIESTTTQQETWILVGGEWFYLPKD